MVMPSYLQTTLHATFLQALVATVLANVGFALAILPAGKLSDKIGRKAVMMAAMALIIVLTFLYCTCCKTCRPACFPKRLRY